MTQNCLCSSSYRQIYLTFIQDAFSESQELCYLGFSLKAKFQGHTKCSSSFILLNHISHITVPCTYGGMFPPCFVFSLPISNSLSLNPNLPHPLPHSEVCFNPASSAWTFLRRHSYNLIHLLICSILFYFSLIPCFVFLFILWFCHKNGVCALGCCTLTPRKHVTDRNFC